MSTCFELDIFQVLRTEVGQKKTQSLAWTLVEKGKQTDNNINSKSEVLWRKLKQAGPSGSAAETLLLLSVRDPLRATQLGRRS